MRKTKDGKVFITPEEAMSLMAEGDNVHTFMNPSGGIMVGADHSRKSLLNSFKAHADFIEIGGPTCRAMKHAIVIATGDAPKTHLFVEHDVEKLNNFDPEGKKEMESDKVN